VTGRLFAFFFFAFMLLTSREPPWADAHVVYDTTQALVDRGGLDVHTEGGHPWFYAFRGGRKYGVFPLGNVVAMVPSYLTYKAAMRFFPKLPDKPTFALAAHVAPSLMMAASCVLFFHLCRRRGASTRWALAATLAMGFTTICFVYARSTYSEALQTLLMLWVVERTLAQGERMTVAGMGWLAMACGTLINAKLVNVLFLPLVAIYVVDRAARRRELGRVWSTLPLALVVFGELAAVALWHNWIKTGSIWDSGYQMKGGLFSGDLLAGAYGLLFSSGKGIFYYSPPLLLGLCGLPTAWQRRRAETVLLLGLMAACVLFNAKFRIWHADYCWGPRHLVSLTPLGLLLAFPWLPEAVERGRPTLRRAAIGLLGGVGLFVQILGASLYWDHYIRILIAMKDQTGAPGWFVDSLSHGHYLPPFSPLRGHFWMLRHLVRQDPDLDRDAPWKVLVPQPADLSDGWRRMRLDWWLLEYTTGIDPSPKVAGAIAGIFVAGTVGGWLTLRRRVAS
jgi:hypothetical protein